MSDNWRLLPGSARSSAPDSSGESFEDGKGSDSQFNFLNDSKAINSAGKIVEESQSTMWSGGLRLHSLFISMTGKEIAPQNKSMDI